MKNRFVLVLFFSFLVINIQYAQRFGIAAVAGINLAQIDGDNQRGFKKVGFVGGVRSIVNFENKWKLHAEILYSQRGASPSDDRNISMDLNYIETPIYISYQIAKYEKGGAYRAYAGASYGKLFSNKVTDVYTRKASEFGIENYLSLKEVATYFNSTDIGTFAGIHILPFDKPLGFDLRYTVSANLLFDNKVIETAVENKSFRGYFISCRVFYEFNHIGKKKKKKGRKK